MDPRRDEYRGEGAPAPARIRLRSLRRHGLVWHVAEAEVEILAAWLGRHFPVRPDSGARFLQAAPNRFVAALDGLVIKEAGPRPNKGRLLFGLRRPAGSILMNQAHALLACGIPTPRPVAWAVRRSGLLRLRDYTITREVKDAEVLTHRLDRLRGNAAGRRALLQAWGALVASLHRHGFSNRDLKDANILCTRDEPLHLWVTDLEGTRRFPFLPASMAAADLRPVAHSLRCHGWLRDPADAASFFAAYNAGVPRRLRRTVFP